MNKKIKFGLDLTADIGYIGMANTLEHLYVSKKGMKCALSLLRKGGTQYFTEYVENIEWFDRQQEIFKWWKNCVKDLDVIAT